MGFYDRVRRVALAAACVCATAAGIGAVAPGSAFAGEGPCREKIAGSGSSLQKAQQKKWQEEVEAKAEPGLSSCTTHKKPKVEYVATSSGKGLEQFGFLTGTLVPRVTPLDAFVGTDDPPTAAQYTKAKEASGSSAETFPVISAPVSVILHPPAECEVSGTSAFLIPNKILDKLWLSGYAKWSDFLKAIETALGSTKFKITNVAKCEVAIKLEIRSDESGTSFAFKQYMSQIDAAEWNSAGKEFVNDKSEFPNTGVGEIHKTHGAGVNNEKGSGEVAAVSEEAGSVGYANLADAAEAPTVFTKWAATTQVRFWAKIQNNGTTEAGAVGTDPEAAGKKGNCPKALNAAQEAALPATAANEPNWTGFHLATTSTAEEAVYPLCTVTYDIGWKEYTTAKLQEALHYNGVGAETGHTVNEYFVFVNATGGVANYYTKLPELVKSRAKETITEKLNGGV